VTIVVHHQRRVVDAMGVPELTLKDTLPIVITCARRTTLLAFRLLLWRHIRRFVRLAKGEEEDDVLRALPVLHSTHSRLQLLL
jgi:hypothetical protein